MKTPTPTKENATGSREMETLVLAGHHLEYLQRVSLQMNPDMPMAFGWPAAIRKILERVVESGIDLTDASSEEEIAQLAAGRLRNKARRRAPRPNERLSATSASTRPGDRQGYRSILPGRGRCRSGTPPRSDHG